MIRQKTTWGRRIKRLLFVFVLLLFAVSAGAVAIRISDDLVTVPLSRQGAIPAQTDSAASVNLPLASEAPESAPSSTSPSCAPASQPPVSQPPASSSQTVSHPSNSESQPPAVPPMDPKIYQAMYPELYAPKTEPPVPVTGKVVYLTFDDGPSNLTMPLLDVLDHYKVKATFFLVGKTDTADLKAMKAIVERGHAIGVHSYTHRLPQIYASPAAFLDDFAKMHDLILKTTGVDTPIYRYAGGSANDYDKSTAKAIITEMNRRGYTYFDWNVDSGDAEYGSTASSIYNNVINQVHAHAQSVVLCHNTSAKKSTLQQIPKIIETLQKEGYRFETLNTSVDSQPYIFRIKK